MTGPRVPAVAVDELPADVHLLDVREDDECAAGRAPGATHLPMSQLTARLDELPADDPLYVVCRSGGRSGRVVAFLVGQGRAAINVAGGMQDWAARGRPLEADGDHPPQVV